MKKTTFLGLLFLYCGFVGTVLIDGILFTTLQWPGGCAMLCVIMPLLFSFLCLCLAIYVFKYGSLNVYVEQELPVAKHLRNVEGTAFIFLSLAIMGFVFRHLHWLGGAQLLLLSCFSLMWLSLIAGLLACILFMHKK